VLTEVTVARSLVTASNPHPQSVLDICPITAAMRPPERMGCDIRSAGPWQ